MKLEGDEQVKTIAAEVRTDGATTDPTRMPPGPLPTPRNFVRYYTDRTRVMTEMAAKYGPTYTMWVPNFGKTVIVTAPESTNALFRMSPDVVEAKEPTLDVMFGSGSIFGKKGEEHRRHRRVLTPPFHGRSLRSFEELVEHETVREMATWPIGREFETHPPTMRITLNIILRAVFGAEGAEFDELRSFMPHWIRFGATLFAIPPLRWDFGPGSLWRRHVAYRRRFDAILERVIATVRADPDFESRPDVLSLLLRSRDEDGEELSHERIGDELVTLLAAGHETTATSLSWAFERLSRNPRVLDRLVEEVDTDGGSTYLQAVIHEVMRTRPAVDGTIRTVYAERMRLGEWVLPRGTTIHIATSVAHNDPAHFVRPAEFDPDRFLGRMPDTVAWTPYGGGLHRCIGATFANMEMSVILRTVLRSFRVLPTDAPDEPIAFRGLPYAPGKGGRIRITPRRRPTVSVTEVAGGAGPASCPFH
ncbi:cytochrome P450 [Tsukamurella pulmonis]|nr:cytochrome P450 [Tsukamurella pulmonis]